MPKYIAFLRAINVGGHTVKMDRLRVHFEELGFTDVETFIASGNVIFNAKSAKTQILERKIESHLQKSLGYQVTAFVRTTSELAAIAAYEPFASAELSATGNTLFVAFVTTSPTKEIKMRMSSLASAIDDFHINGREVYWLYRRSAGESKFYGALLERSLGMRT